MYQLKSVSVERVTKSLVKRYREMPKCPEDCPIYEDYVTFLKAEIKAKRMQTADIAEAYVKGKPDERNRYNGKHTMEACWQVIEETGNIPAMKAIIREYELDSPADSPMLYAIFDTKEATRSVRDVYKGFVVNDVRWEGVKIRHAATVISAIAFAQSFSKAYDVNARDRAKLAMDYFEFARWYETIADKTLRPKKFFLRLPVCAAMFKTWQECDLCSSTFWIEACSGSNSDPASATRKCRDALLSSVIGGGAGVIVSEKNKVLGRPELMALCINHWNAFVANKKRIAKFEKGTEFPETSACRCRTPKRHKDSFALSAK